MSRGRLHERAREAETIAEALGEAIAGRGRVVVLEGPAGIGKTSLIELARAAAQEREVAVATARGSELEVAYAWGVVRQLFEPRLRGMSAAARGRTLTGAAALAEPIVLPGDAPAAFDADPTFGVLHGLYWLAAALADAATAPARRRRPALGRRRLDPVPRVPREPARRAAGAAARGPAAARRTARSAGRRSRPRSSWPRCRSPARPPCSRERDGAPVSASFAEACHAATGGNPLLVRRLAEGLRDREDAGAVARAGPDAVAGAVARHSRASATGRRGSPAGWRCSATRRSSWSRG